MKSSYSSNARIQAIKELRASTNFTLSEACRRIDTYVAEHHVNYHQAVEALTKENPRPPEPLGELESARMQLAAAHETIGEALALLRQGQDASAILVLDDALRAKA